MKLSLFIFVLTVLCFTFFIKKKRLTVLEIISIWLFEWIIIHTIASIILINFRYLSVSDDFSDFWIHVLKRLFLYPILIIWSFDLFLAYTSKLLKFIHLLLTVLLLMLVEYFFIWIGVIHIIHWNIQDSLIEWSLSLFTAYFFWYWFRRQLEKGF